MSEPKTNTKILVSNLKATDIHLRDKNMPSWAYYVRQALDIIEPNWREKA